MGGWVGFEFARGMGGAKVYEAYEVEKKKGKFNQLKVAASAGEYMEV